MKNILTNPKFIKINFDIDFQESKGILNKSINNASCIVIGGGGTIGSNYIKQLLLFKPAVLYVVDFNENSLTELTRDLRSSMLLDYEPEYKTYPVDMLSDTFDKVFASHSWDVVANFSAHKHVRSEKDKISIEALIRNNVFGAIKLLNLCEKLKPKFFFSVSTDKAANPVNIMGASKNLMEKLILSKKNIFRVTTARFANVAFSNGSLLDGFNYRIKKNQPLSCPSDIKRFFVTPEQSGIICLLSTFIGKSGNIFFPKLDFSNDQVYFKDIAIEFLVQNGFEPKIMFSEKEAKEYDINENYPKYPIYFFKTDTSGEKTYEEFYTEKEDYRIDEFASIGYINSTESKRLVFDDVFNDFDKLFSNSNFDKTDIINTLKKYVSDFNHLETGKNLDQKM